MTKLLTCSVLSAVAGSLLLAGCSNTQTGTATPVGSTAPVSSGASSSQAPGGATTTSLDPCSLLAASDLGSFGSSFVGPRKRQAGGARSCGYVKQLADASDEDLSVDVNIRDTQSIESANDAGAGINRVAVNGRQAAQVPTPPNICVLALAVGANSRVDVTIISKDTTKACDIATQVATKIVEPKLPKA